MHINNSTFSSCPFFYSFSELKRVKGSILTELREGEGERSRRKPISSKRYRSLLLLSSIFLWSHNHTHIHIYDTYSLCLCSFQFGNDPNSHLRFKPSKQNGVRIYFSCHFFLPHWTGEIGFCNHLCTSLDVSKKYLDAILYLYLDVHMYV